MTFLKQVIVFLIVMLLITLFVWFFNTTEDEPTSSPKNHALNESVLACDGIAERAAAHLVAIVEFQKLEIAGRKARVFKVCMHDRGYVENPEWLKYSAPVAAKIAKETTVSVDEAIENLRRNNMKKTTANKDRSNYWVIRSKGSA